MFRFTTSSFIVSLSLIVLASWTIAAAGPLPIDLEKMTPVGSWQQKETISVDHKGKQKVTRSKTSIVGEEKCGDVMCFWLEMEMQEYKGTGADAKPTGKKMITKVLMERGIFKDLGVNALNNFTSKAKTLIMKSGDDKPVKMQVANNPMMAAMTSGSDMKVEFDYQDAGEESVKLPAGSFDTKKYNGKGRSEVSIFGKKIVTDNVSTIWVSNSMPFGIVKSHMEMTTDGKTTVNDDTVIGYGMSGATSQITGPIEEMPAFPGFPGK